MTKGEFEKITKRIEDAYRDPFTEGQFNQWYEIFKGEDYGVVDRAVAFLVDEYKYFPVPATLREYIRRIKSSEEEKEQHTKREALLADTSKAPQWFLGMGRFMDYLQANKIKFGNWDIEKLKAEKAKFEKEQPNWKRRSKEMGISQIGSLLGKVLKREFEKEE